MASAAYQPVVQDEETFELRERGSHDDSRDEASSPPQLKHGSHIRTANPFYLVIYFLINHIALGIIIVPRMNLFMTLVCRDLMMDSAASRSDAQRIVIGGANLQCHDPVVSSAVAALVSVTTMLSGIMGVFMAPFLGRLSDRIGRLKVMVWNMSFICLSRLALLAVAWSGGSSKWIYLSFVVYGLSGTAGTTMNVSAAYISDCTTPATRSIQIGRIHGIMFAGMAVGPLLSSGITKLSGNKMPLLVFYIDFVLIFISVLFLYFVIPESLTKPLERVRQGLKNTLALPGAREKTGKTMSIAHRVQAVDPRTWLRKLVPDGSGAPSYFRKNVALLILVNLIIVTGAVAPSEVAILYPQTTFNWTNVETNIYMAVVNTCRAFATIVGLPLLIAFLRSLPNVERIAVTTTLVGADRLDQILIVTAISFDILGFMGYALSPSGIFYILSGALAAFGSIGQPTTVSALTKHIDVERFGELMGGLGMLQGLMDFVAPAMVSLVYSWTATTVPSLAFVGLSVFLGCGVALMLFVQIGGP